MKMLNRNAVTVRPKQPFKDWVATLDGADPVDDNPADTECPVYLLPETTNPHEFQVVLQQNFAIIFANELLTWHTDESDWPRTRNWETFCAWFQIDFGSEVFDLGTEPMKVEEM